MSYLAKSPIWAICVVSLVFLLLFVLLGCGDDNDNGKLTGTGVRDLDTPDQILENPYVRDALEQADNSGAVITPEKGIDPPVISGRYSISGEAIVPGYTGWHDLNPGTWRWYNQTADNHIDTHYDQIGLQTGQGGGEIIRGVANRFTVYSVLFIDDESVGGCKERAVVIVDGEQDSDGDVSAVYISVAAQQPVCHAATVGRLELTLTGPAKATTTDIEGAGVMMIVIDSIMNSSGRKNFEQ